MRYIISVDQHEHEFDVKNGGTNGVGIWSDGSVIWIQDEHGKRIASFTKWDWWKRIEENGVEKK